MEGTSIARKWGNSLGIVLSKEIVETEKIKENEEIHFLIIPKHNPLKDSFGRLKH